MYIHDLWTFMAIWPGHVWLYYLYSKFVINEYLEVGQILPKPQVWKEQPSFSSNGDEEIINCAYFTKTTSPHINSWSKQIRIGYPGASLPFIYHVPIFMWYTSLSITFRQPLNTSLLCVELPQRLDTKLLRWQSIQHQRVIVHSPMANLMQLIRHIPIDIKVYILWCLSSTHRNRVILIYSYNFPDVMQKFS